MSGLGRRTPSDWAHVEKHPLTGALAEPPPAVEKILRVPSRYRDFYDQGREGACVGFAGSWMMSFLNGRRYDARSLWNKAKEIDEWPDTNPGDDNGTSVRAGADVLRTLGHRRNYRNTILDWNTNDGIIANKWATQVDQVRACIASGAPVQLGINWYDAFDRPSSQYGAGEWWIGRSDLGTIRGGHSICCYGASDRRQAVKLINSWGRGYPLVWLPYAVLQRLLDEDGEATVVTDNPEK